MIMRVSRLERVKQAEHNCLPLSYGIYDTICTSLRSHLILAWDDRVHAIIAIPIRDPGFWEDIIR